MAFQLAIIVILFFQLWVATQIRKKAVGRGYLSPIAVYGALYLVSTAAWLIPVSAAASAGWTLGEITILLIGSCTVVMLCCAYGVARLPARQRPAGLRAPRLRFRPVAVVCGVGAIACFALAANTGSIVEHQSPILTLLAAGTVAAISDRRMRTPSVEEARAGDPRAPVLYLRPFKRDLEGFSTRNQRPFNSLLIRITTIGGVDTFESFMRTAVTDRIGPVIALGNPADYIPPAISGAARTYYSDASWREQVAKLVSEASCILAIAGESESLAWEFDHILNSCAASKLFIVASPYGKGRRRPVMLVFYNLLRGFRAPNLARASRVLTDVGYALPPGPIPNGAVVGFTDTGQAVIVRSGARTPTDYVEAIVGSLSSSGRDTPG